MIRVSAMKVKNIGILDGLSFNSNFNLEIDKTENTVAKEILIKGNNATGKTTLSKIFRSIEYRNNPEESKAIVDEIISYDKDDAEIEVQLSDGDRIIYDASNGIWYGKEDAIVKVFNIDYIERKIDFGDFSKNKLTGAIETNTGRISEEKIKYEKAIKEREKNQNQLFELSQEIDKKIAIKNKELRKIGLHINDENYKYYIDTVNFNGFALSSISERLEKNISNYKELKNTIDVPRPNQNDIDIDKFILIFNKNYFYEYEEAEKHALQELNHCRENERQWKLSGLEYQKDRGKCVFCGQDLLDLEKIHLYERYRDSKINHTKDQLKQLTEQELPLIDSMINGLRRSQDALKRINLKLFNIDADIESIFLDIYDLKRTILELNELIKGKIEKDVIVPKEKVNNLFSKFQEQLEKIYIVFDLIKTYENEVNKITTKRNRLSREIKRDSEISFFLENKDDLIEKYFKKDKELKRALEIEREMTAIYIQKEQERKREIRIMKELFIHLGIIDYDIDNEFNLRWRNHAYSGKKYNLSTGEISAIAFSYFVASLMVELTQDQKNNLIIWIDDPVCSIDYQRIFSIVTMILDIPNLLAQKQNEDGSEGKGSQNSQIFVTTHNDLLFNFLAQSNQFKRIKKGIIFELYKVNEKTFIRECKKSEQTIYLNKLIKIIEIADKKSCDLELSEVLYIPNYIRYVLEQLKQWMYPDLDNMLFFLNDKLEFSRQDSCLLKKLYDVYSHVVPASDEERVISKEEIQKCCQLIRDKIQYLFNGQMAYVAAARKD